MLLHPTEGVTGFMEQRSFDRFRNYLATRLGLQFEERSFADLEAVVEQRLRELGFDEIAPYLSYLESSNNRKKEVRALAEQLTVGETYFYRHWGHVQAFSEVVLPNLARARATQRRLRILSAGCASGEEPYTLAMSVRDHWPALPGWDIHIQAIDINHSFIQKAKKACYSSWSLRDTPKQAQDRYFQRTGSVYAVEQSVRDMVEFEERNLLDEDAAFWQPNSIDVIFCRNVVIYFSPQATLEVIARFERALASGGYLFLGHSETLRGISQAFDLCHTHETFYYQRRQQQAGRRAFSAPRPLPVDHSPVIDSADSWPEIIRNASERIALLASGATPTSKAPVNEPIQESLLGNAPPPPLHGGTQLALELFRQERFEDALEQLERLPVEFETDCDMQLLRAAALTNRGKLAEAEAICAQLLRLDSLNPGAHYLRALCREHAGDHAMALADAKAAVYLDQSFAMPHLQLGLIAKRSGDSATARHELSLALALLAREDPARILLFGGGFNRESLIQLCRSEARALGEEAIG